MASVVDYLRQQRVEKDKEIENLVRNTGTYDVNRQALQALGQGTPDEQDKGFAKKALGLGSNILNIIGIPGRLVQAGVLEAVGRPSEDLQRVSGLEQLGAIIKGDVNTSASNLPFFKTRPGDSTGARIGKMIGAFALDVGTDPTSYISAPASISRKAAATSLFRTANKPAFLENVLTKSIKGDSLVDDLLKDVPVARFAEMQKSMELAQINDIVAAAEKKSGRLFTAEERANALTDVKKSFEAGRDINTPVGVLDKTGRDALATQQLADRLGTALFTKGRTGLIKELENLTGSRNSALSIFKSLPDEIRGGIVLSNLLGKPIKGADGKYVRLTSGALVPGLRKTSEVANQARQLASVYPGNLATRMVSGEAGPILADLKKAALGSETKGPSRLMDYIVTKDELAQRRVNINKLQGRVLNASVMALHSKKAFDAAAGKEWDETFKQYFFAPAVKFDDTTATVAQRAAFEAAGMFRSEINALRAEASKLGLDINVLGDANTWSPLMLTDEAFDKFKRTGKLPDGIRQYNPDQGRDSFVVREENPDLADKIGFRDPENPEVVYLHAKEANDRLQKQAIERGMSEEAAAAERVFIEDPIQIMSKYGSWVAGAASNKRFADALLESGVVIKDVPAIRRLLNEVESATFISSVAGASDVVKGAAASRLAAAEKAIVDKANESLITLKRQINSKREELIGASQLADTQVDTLTRQLVDAQAIVDEASPRISSLQKQLQGYSRWMEQANTNLPIKQRAVKNVKARLSTAEAGFAEKRNAEKIIADLYRQTPPGPERDALEQVMFDISGEASDAASNLRSEMQLLEADSAALEQIKSIRASVKTGTAQDLQDQILSFEKAVSERNRLRTELFAARKNRTATRLAAANVEKTVGIEQINMIDNLISAAAEARKDLAIFEAINKPTKNSPPNILADQKRLKDEVALTESSIKAVLNAKDTPFTALAREYAKLLSDASKKLSREQFQNAMVLTNELKIQQAIKVVYDGARDEEIVMKAMGDMVQSWESIREILGKKALQDLSKAQRSLLLNSNLKKIKEGVIREGTEPSALVSAFDDAGYSVLNKSIGKQKVYASYAVSEVLESMFRTKENPNSWQKFLSDYLDPLLLAWKTGITIGRGPGYLLNNLAGGLYMNYLGNVDVSWFIKANKVVNATNKTLKRLTALNPNMSSVEVGALAHDEVLAELNKTRVGSFGVGDAFKHFIDKGGLANTELGAVSRDLARSGLASQINKSGVVIGSTWDTAPVNAAEKAYRDGLNFLFTNKLQVGFNNLAQTSEVRLRFAAFMDGLDKYDDLGAAMDQVHILHFDYADLSDAEQWVRRLVPFYTWTRRNVPAQMRALMMQPGKIQRFLYANEEFKNAFGAEGDESWLNQVLPEYIDNQNGFVTKFKFLDNNVGTYLRLPFEDVNRMFGLYGKPRTEELVNMVGPYKIPLELATGRDLATGRPLDTFGKDRLEVAGNILPQFGTAQRAVAGIGGAAKQFGVDLPNVLWTQNQEDKGIATALQLLGGGSFGVGIASISKKSISGELYGRIQEQSAKINKEATKLGVDPAWMREQLRSGVTPERLANMIAAGMGKVSEETQYSKLTNEQRQRALQSLQGL
jgi:hypothetical protein